MYGDAISTFCCCTRSIHDKINVFTLSITVSPQNIYSTISMHSDCIHYLSEILHTTISMHIIFQISEIHTRIAYIRQYQCIQLVYYLADERLITEHIRQYQCIQLVYYLSLILHTKHTRQDQCIRLIYYLLELLQTNQNMAGSNRHIHA